MSRNIKECPWPYKEMIVPMSNGESWKHRYLSTDMYIIKDNKLYNLVEETTSEDLYVPLSKEQLLVYQEELDGSAISKQEAISKYPEEFV